MGLTDISGTLVCMAVIMPSMCSTVQKTERWRKAPFTLQCRSVVQRRVNQASGANVRRPGSLLKVSRLNR